MRTDQEIIDIVKNKKGGYMTLEKDEKDHYSANLKGVNGVTQEVEKTPSSDAVSQEQIQQMIDAAVNAKTNQLREENEELRRDAEVLSQDEFQDFTPPKPVNLTCRLRMYRETTDQNYEIITNGQHIVDKLIENKTGVKIPTPMYRFTLVDYLNCKSYDWGAYNLALRRVVEIEKSLKRTDDKKLEGKLEAELDKHKEIIKKYGAYTRTIDLEYEVPFNSEKHTTFEMVKINKILQRKGEGKVKVVKSKMESLGDFAVKKVWGANDASELKNNYTSELVDAIVVMEKTHVDLVCTEKGVNFTMYNFNINNVNN